MKGGFLLKYHKEVPHDHPEYEAFTAIYRNREKLWDHLLGVIDRGEQLVWTRQEIEDLLRSIQEYIYIDDDDAKYELSKKQHQSMIDGLCRISISLLSSQFDNRYITTKLYSVLRQIVKS